MTPKLTLYSRKECCLCEEMKKIIRHALEGTPFDLEEIDIDGAPELLARFDHEVPVLFIDGKKAFKHRLAAEELRRYLERRTSRQLWKRPKGEG